MEDHQFESLRHDFKGLRREIVELRERSDQRFERLLHEIVELRLHTDNSLRELRQEVRGWVDDARRHFQVLAEDLRSDIKLLAEGLVAVNERLDRVEARLEDQMDRGFADTHALIRLSYRDLDRRVTTLEGSAPS